jgi:hypothetical protein
VSLPVVTVGARFRVVTIVPVGDVSPSRRDQLNAADGLDTVALELPAGPGREAARSMNFDLAVRPVDAIA